MLPETKKTTQGKSKVKISNKVKDYGNDAYLVKKAKESKEFLEEHSRFPKELLIKK